ncbi:MAG: arsenate reductase (glutaredoxin) [Brevundimonas sp.]
MSDFPVTVFHNPACGTSRNVVAAVREAGLEPEVVAYLQAGWPRAQLEDLLARMGGARPREILRERGTPAAELGLLGEDVSDDTLLEAMVAHPILVDRPMVATPLGVVLARPSERVFEVLDRRPGSFTMEDGAVVEL